MSAIPIKADQERGVALAGVPGLVPRPVDIDQTHTAFAVLRTLRIYHFEPPAVIAGHAEEDEVFVVVLTGSAELLIRSDNWSSSATRFTLMAADGHASVACAAYLPPHAEYELVPRAGADIAYVRAKPSSIRVPGILTSTPRTDDSSTCVLLDDSAHAERLRVRLLRTEATQRAVAVKPIQDFEGSWEALIHIRTTPKQGAVRIETAGAPSRLLESWDTVAVVPADAPALHIGAGSAALSLIVAAR